MNAIHDFLDAIRSFGMEPPDMIEPGKFHRFPGVGKCTSNRSGWCKLYDCGTAGVFGDWSSGISEDWQGTRNKSRSKRELKVIAQHAAETRAQAEREREAAQAEAAVEAARIWESAIPATSDHQYLRTKGIGPHGSRMSGQDLLVPLFDISVGMQSLQRIGPDGTKRFLPGGAITGNFYTIGEYRDMVILCEGFATGGSLHEATGYAVCIAFNCGNLLPVARALRAKYPNCEVIIAADDDSSTHGNPGLAKATAAANAIGARLAVPDFGSSRQDGATDFNDLLRHAGLEAVRACIDASIDLRPDGVKLLDDVRDFVGQFCAFPSSACLDAVALWAAHTHMVEHFHTTPRLAMLSPEPGSGKTRVLEVLDLLTADAMLVLSPSAPAIFRKLAQTRVTLLFDECDAIFARRGDDGHNEDLRALINSGYRRGASIPRCVGSQHEVREFLVYAAAALAGLGDLPDTIMSRSLVIRMRKRSATEQVEPFRTRIHESPGHALRNRLVEWAAVVGAAAGADWPAMPPNIVDRKAEIWEPLIAVADQAGGHWPDTARQACVELCASADNRRASLGVRLLADLRIVFGEADSLTTTTILARLRGTEPYATDGQGEVVYIAEDAPWGEMKGKALDPRGLARMLRKYDVSPAKIKHDGRALQGYRRVDLWDAWQRYLPLVPAEAEPPEPPATSRQWRVFQADSEVPDKSPVPEALPDSGPAQPLPDADCSAGSGCSAVSAIEVATLVRTIEI
jgi:phage/plasmid primase-like uncharacterized protein